MGNSVWAHNPAHRLGVPYANREVAERFARNGGVGAGAERSAGARSEGFAAGQRFGSQGFEQRAWTGSHSVFGGYHNGGMARMQSDRGFASLGAGRAFGGGMRAGGFGGFHGGGGRR